MNRSRLLRVAAALALLLGSAGIAQSSGAADADPVVLRLGSSTWTRSDVESRFELALRSIAANRGLELTDEVRRQLASLRPQFLEGRAREVVLLEEARERGLGVSDERVDAEVERIRSGFEDAEAFREQLVRSGIGDVERLRRLVRENETMNALYEHVRSTREMSQDRLRVAYLSRRDVFRTAERACASHILLESAADAEAVLADLEGGADFAALAEERSVGPTAPAGGDLGCFERGRMVPAFEEAVFGGDVGVPLGPVETEFGQHVILVTERQEAGTAPFAEVRDDVASALVEAETQRIVEALVETSGVVTHPERFSAPAAAPAPGGSMPEGSTPEGSTPTPPVPAPVEPDGSALD